MKVGGTDPGDFSAKSGCGTSRKTGWDCTITVTFTSTVIGARSATLNVKDAVGTQAVQRAGTGKQEPVRQASRARSLLGE